jgi:hypothetical protein
MAEKVGLSDEPIIRLITPPCPRCGETSEVMLTRKEFAMLAHPSRPLIQDCLPDRDVDFCELVKSGYHSTCWDADMKPLDEED